MAASALKQTLKGDPADGKAMTLREIAAFVERARSSGASGHEHVQVTATLGGKVKRLAVEIEQPRSATATHSQGLYRLRAGGTVEVVGEAYYQVALERVAGGRSPDSADLEVTATLLPEPDNPYDPNAIAVRIDGATVGYMSREDAIDYGPVVQRLAAMGCVGACQARIKGGWDRGNGDRGHFGLVLALAPPGQALG